MTQPDALKSDETLFWSTGRGTDVWNLFCACIAGDLAKVQRLLNSNPSLVRCHYSYRTPIYLAVRENQLSVASFLLDHGADPLSLAVNDSLLDITRDRGYCEMEQLLEAKIAQFHGASSEGEPIAAAIRERDLAKVQALLNGSLELLHAGGEDICSTPLGWAAKFGQKQMVEFLLQRGAKPNLPEDPPWATPLAWATRRGHFEIAEILKQNNAR